MESEVTWTGGARAEGEIDRSPLAGRYRLGALLGRGGSGQVFRAVDQLTGEEVAVKFVAGLGAHVRRQLRRELAALLALRLPGVVRLRDEGVAGDVTFLVTDIVDGRPFSSLRERGGVDAWLPSVLALLDTLARVHLAGVVHRDLKPGNVLVDRAGRPVILDFGLAQGRVVEAAASGLVEGTPRYMAPEQRRGDPCDERTDLYAVGGMIHELVTGQPPTLPVDVGRLERASLPPELLSVLLQMLAEDPEDRPASALDVLVALDADPRADLTAALGEGPWTEGALRGLFAGRDVSFLHLADDGARLLHAAGGGDPRRTRAELDRWIRAGLASWTGDGRILVDRPALERIAAGRGPEATLVALLETGADPDVATLAARRSADRLWRAGALERALSVLDAAELWARGTRGEGALLVDRVALALGLEGAAAVDRALHHVQRAEVPGELRAALTGLLRAARAAYNREPRRALELLDALRAPLPEPLAIWRRAIEVKAAQMLDLAEHERRLATLDAWAGADPVRRGKADGWVGNLRYRQGRYEEAAALHVAAARAKRGRHEQISSALCAAAAFLEAGHLDDARDQANRALRLARSARHPQFEGHAWWLLRTLRYRGGRRSAPRVDLVDAAAEVGPQHEARIALTEAAFAWRYGSDRAAELAGRAARAFRAVGYAPGALLAGALAWRAGARGADPIAIAREAAELPAELAIQVLGLLGAGGGPDARARAKALLPELGGLDPRRRLDLISVREAARALELPDPP